MLEYASMRLTDSCRPAIRLATVMVRTARMAMIGGHPVAHEESSGWPNATRSTRSSVAKAALLTATAMYAVAGVGAPSYASGVHMWKGTALTLKARPVITSAAAMSTSP